MACVLYNPYAVCEPSDLANLCYFDNEYNIRLSRTMIAFALTHILILFALTVRINYLAKHIKELKQTVYNMHEESRDRGEKVITGELRAIEE